MASSACGPARRCARHRAARGRGESHRRHGHAAGRLRRRLVHAGRCRRAVRRPPRDRSTVVGDPGNAGTLMRSAAAAGASALGLGLGSVDAYNPKVVRASAGACFAIRTVEGVPAVEHVGSARRAWCAAVGRGRDRRHAPRPARPARTRRVRARPRSPRSRRRAAARRARDHPDAGGRVAQRRDGRHRSVVRSGPPAERVDEPARRPPGRAAAGGGPGNRRAHARRARGGRTHVPQQFARGEDRAEERIRGRAAGDRQGARTDRRRRPAGAR